MLNAADRLSDPVLAKLEPIQSSEGLCDFCNIHRIRFCERRGIIALLKTHSIGVEGCTRCDRFQQIPNDIPPRTQEPEWHPISSAPSGVWLVCRHNYREFAAIMLSRNCWTDREGLLRDPKEYRKGSPCA
jgi:hypothetical protein